MTDQGISQLSENTDPQGVDLLTIVRNSDNVWLKALVSTIKNKTVGIIPSALAYHNAHQSVASGSDVVLAMNSEFFDTNGIHDTVTNNSRLTCKTIGKYFIFVDILYATNAAGYRGVGLLYNGATIISRFRARTLNTVGVAITTATVYDLAVNDYVESFARQTSGGGLNVEYHADYSPIFGMIRIAD